MASNEVFADVKADYARRFQGAVLPKVITLGSPTIRQFYKRNFDQLGRNSYYVSVFGRILLDENQAREAEQNIYDCLKETEEECARMINLMQELANNGGVDELAQFHRAEEFKASVIVPAQSRYLRCLVQGDQYLVLVNTLWLEGLLDDAQKSRAELSIKKALRKVSTRARNLRIGLQKRIMSGSTSPEVLNRSKSEAIDAEASHAKDEAVEAATGAETAEAHVESEAVAEAA